MAKATGKNKGKGDEQPPKYLYRYIPFERLAEILIRREIPVPRPQNWKDQHDLDNAVKKIPSGETVGIACFTSKCGTSFHWDLFAKYGVRLAFDASALEKCVHRVSKKQSGKNAQLKKVDYVTTKEYIKMVRNPKTDLLFVKRDQYESEREWRIVCLVSKPATVHVAQYIPFEWGDLKKITISPHYSISDYHFHKAMILKMLESIGAKNIPVLRSSLFVSKKIKDAEAELDFEEDEK